MIAHHRHTYGPTKYSWSIEQRLSEITDLRLFKSVKRKLGTLYRQFCAYYKDIEFIPEESKDYFKYALFTDFYNRIVKNKSFEVVDHGIRENFIKVLKEKLKEDF